MDIALQKERHLRVQSACQIEGDQILRIALELSGILCHGDGMQVGDEDIHLIFILILYKLADGTDIVAQRPVVRSA